jgi:hypothetical protein
LEAFTLQLAYSELFGNHTLELEQVKIETDIRHTQPYLNRPQVSIEVRVLHSKMLQAAEE